MIWQGRLAVTGGRRAGRAEEREGWRGRERNRDKKRLTMKLSCDLY